MAMAMAIDLRFEEQGHGVVAEPSETCVVNNTKRNLSVSYLERGSLHATTTLLAAGCSRILPLIGAVYVRTAVQVTQLSMDAEGEKFVDHQGPTNFQLRHDGFASHLLEIPSPDIPDPDDIPEPVFHLQSSSSGTGSGKKSRSGATTPSAASSSNVSAARSGTGSLSLPHSARTMSSAALMCFIRALPPDHRKHQPGRWADCSYTVLLLHYMRARVREDPQIGALRKQRSSLMVKLRQQSVGQAQPAAARLTATSVAATKRKLATAITSSTALRGKPYLAKRARVEETSSDNSSVGTSTGDHDLLDEADTATLVPAMIQSGAVAASTDELDLVREELKRMSARVTSLEEINRSYERVFSNMQRQIGALKQQVERSHTWRP